MKRAPSEYDFLDILPQLPASVVQQRIESLLENLGFVFLRQEKDDGWLYSVRNKGCIRAHYGRATYNDPGIGPHEADCLLYYDGLDETIREQVRTGLQQTFDEENVRAA